MGKMSMEQLSDLKSFYSMMGQICSEVLERKLQDLLTLEEVDIFVPVLAGRKEFTPGGTIGDLRALKELLEHGFDVRWKVDNSHCKECEKFEGRCGFDVSGKKFRCWCLDDQSSSSSNNTCTVAILSVLIVLNCRQIAFFTGPTVGGLLNATCGNATELIIAIFALTQHKVDVVKYSLLGSILSNLLLVLGTSLFCGGIANLSKEQKYDRKQADVNSLLLLLGLLCHVLPLLFNYAGVGESAKITAEAVLQLSRASCIVMLIAYFAYLIFQLWTHRQLFDAEAEVNEEDDDAEDEEAVLGFWSAFAWLVGMTLIIALLSEYVVGTIEAASDSWGISVSFISVILLPIVGNAAEHAGAVIFAFKNKLDISLGVALGSATQIAMFVVPLCVIVSWIIGVRMDLDFNLLETGSLALAIIVTAFTLQDGTSHYIKGLVLLLCYIVISACFFVSNRPQTQPNAVNLGSSTEGIMRV
ncbi:vacuolar cation/proton exchanger 3-like [Lycium ferocissimum]|uniref:vacuolar cation/proton exchanger 3-like n=1 Tax=Lycium ferocissimum TaxID=112874 RepID=UPI002814997B|nr:vacuolar cation/proton exchanger 3-like [Lycium ferocissimum]